MSPVNQEASTLPSLCFQAIIRMTFSFSVLKLLHEMKLQPYISQCRLQPQIHPFMPSFE